MIEVGENEAPSEIPSTGVWYGGSLNLESRCFDVLCAGKVETSSKNQLEVSAVSKDIPDFFTKDSEGNVVFAEPKSMCAIKMPKGHRGSIVIRLKKTAVEQGEEYSKYVCLGVKVNGVIADWLYTGNSAKYLDITDSTSLELVPLLSTSDLSVKYTEAKVGSAVSGSGIQLPGTNFNFGTVFRVLIGNDQKISSFQSMEQTEGHALASVGGDSTSTECNFVSGTTNIFTNTKQPIIMKTTPTGSGHTVTFEDIDDTDIANAVAVTDEGRKIISGTPIEINRQTAFVFPVGCFSKKYARDSGATSPTYIFSKQKLIYELENTVVKTVVLKNQMLRRRGLRSNSGIDYSDPSFSSAFLGGGTVWSYGGWRVTCAGYRMQYSLINAWTKWVSLVISADTVDATIRHFDVNNNEVNERFISQKRFDSSVQTGGYIAHVSSGDSKIYWAQLYNLNNCTLNPANFSDTSTGLYLAPVTTPATTITNEDGTTTETEEVTNDVIHFEGQGDLVVVVKPNVDYTITHISSTDEAITTTLVDPTTMVIIDSENYKYEQLESGYNVNLSVSNIALSNLSMVSGFGLNKSNGIGVGSVGRETKMLAVNFCTGELASSVDGENWTSAGSLYPEGETKHGNFNCGLVHGNGLWCAITEKGYVKYSNNGTKSWIDAFAAPNQTTDCLAYGNGVFMTVGHNQKVYASRDASRWKEIGEVPYFSDSVHLLQYNSNDSGKWICATFSGYVYESEDGHGTWKSVEGNLGWFGHGWGCGCFAYGFSYAIDWNNGTVVKSSDGKNWEKVDILGEKYYNISCYENKLYAFNADGVHYSIANFE